MLSRLQPTALDRLLRACAVSTGLGNVGKCVLEDVVAFVVLEIDLAFFF
jgi:hypothetical protein